MNEINLYQDLEKAELFYKYCRKYDYKDTAKRALSNLKSIQGQIKKQYPDLDLLPR